MIRGKGALSLNSIADVWTIVLDRLRSQLSETTINTWFDEVEAVTMEEGMRGSQECPQAPSQSRIHDVSRLSETPEKMRWC